MSKGWTFILHSERDRQRAIAQLARIPLGAVVKYEPKGRTIPQNDKMWAGLTDVALAKPEGRSHPTHVWKALVMDMAGCKPQWERSLDGQGIVCVGYKSSRLTKTEMSDVIEALNSYCAEHGIGEQDQAA